MLRFPIDPRVQHTLDFAGFMLEAAEAGAKRLQRAATPRRRGSYAVRRPGAETPMWNACALLLQHELRPFGAKARLARYLGIPRQRLTDFIVDRSRLPDAEMTLQMLTWVAYKRSGRDLSS